MLMYNRDSARLVRFLLDDEHDGTDSSISIKVEASEVDIFEQSVRR